MLAVCSLGALSGLAAQASPIMEATSDTKERSLSKVNDTFQNAQALSIRIGNLHALMPGAIAFIQDDAAGIVLDIGADKTGRPGISAPDH